MGEILFLAHRVPYPPDRGDKIRSWNMVKALAKLAPVHVAALCDDPADAGHAGVIAGVAASVHLIPHRASRAEAMASALLTGQPASVRACASPHMQAVVETLLRTRPIDTIFAFSGQMAQFAPARLDGRRFVMDFVDVDSAKFEAFSNAGRPLARFANAQEAKRLFAWECAVARRADASLFVSEAEAGLFRSRSGIGGDRVLAVENGIDTGHFTPAHPALPRTTIDGPLIVFTGQMDYAPNVEAVRSFALDTLPLIRARVPDACFAIVGRAPVPDVATLAAQPGVLVTGTVPDTRDWIAAAAVVVAPLRLARGIQNKVLEAMAMARPVVASRQAALGIDAVDGRDLVIADGPAAEADAVVALLDDPRSAQSIGDAARNRMIARYGWEAQLARLGDIVGPDSGTRAAA
jgi:sugar transferase (PEP-CTERM/EpsH1 system associated)